MRRITGKSVYGGIAIGRIYVYKKEKKQVPYWKTTETDREIRRFSEAREKALKQLQELYEKAEEAAGKSSAAIFEAHQMMLKDEYYINAVEEKIKKEQINAEYAVSRTEEELDAVFSSMEDSYISERAADIKDVSERILSILSGTSKEKRKEKEPFILVADDLTPSETVQIDKEKVLSFVTVHGSVNSHTAILAKTMNIPALIGVPVTADKQLDGKMAIVNGEEGWICIDPDAITLERYKKKQEEERKEREALQALRGKESKTLDGKKVLLCANIGDLKGLESAMENGADGIGLFRSEMLYLGKETYPTEEEQFKVYKTLAETMAGKEVIIRTLDIGADKHVAYFQMEQEENPAMGCRAIRICLRRPEIFKTQLRALFRASVYGKISILYPMITSVEEIEKIQQIIEEIKQELKEKNLAFGEPKQGIMIETPAAALISDLLAEQVGFFSIGTNDLTQYTLAVDRQNPRMEEWYHPYHEAVLRLIAITVQNGHKAGIRVGICGELGSDPNMTEAFLRMGVDELSVNPGSILPMKRRICEMDLSVSAIEKDEKTDLKNQMIT
ncbi:MAG: phosphoenolpyruvate--protein phosphotransferase [Eubacteriales bacterium]|nr:phosphoenolpyruvate--protein phosphotransferase [Eubacteriales bacterium]